MEDLIRKYGEIMYSIEFYKWASLQTMLLPEGTIFSLYQWPFESGKILTFQTIYDGQMDHDTQFWNITISKNWTSLNRLPSKKGPSSYEGLKSDGCLGAKPTYPYISKMWNKRFDEHVQYMKSMYSGGCSIAMFDYRRVLVHILCMSTTVGLWSVI